MKSSLFFSAVLFIFFGFAACHKASDPGPARYTGCRISQVVETSNGGSGSQYIFSYNNDGTVANIMLADLQSGTVESNKKFVYGKNFIKMGTFNAGSTQLSELDSMVLDGQRRVDMYINAKQGFQTQESSHYNYDVVGELMSYTSTYSGGQYDYAFQYQDGDVIIESIKMSGTAGGSDSSGYSYTYDTALYNTGNMKIAVDDLENYGVAISSRHHLRTREYYDPTSYTTYSYSRDGAGKITGITTIYYSNGTPSTSTTQITYACE